MKRAAIVLLPLAFDAAILTPKAATADPADYTYIVSGDAATITGYTGAGGDIIIPDTLGGYPVTTIPPADTLEFIDPAATAHSSRFYRIIGP
jgi:hypothetical protein